MLVLGSHLAYLILCIVVGIAAFAPHKAQKHRWLMPAFLALLTGLVLFGAIGAVVHWAAMIPVVRILYVGVLVTGLYALYRGARAQRQLREHVTD
jgi:Na+/alanine symporter